MSDTAVTPGMKVRVHFNLHKGGYSIIPRPGTKVMANVPDITLTDVTFHVQPGALARIRKTGQREICAYAVGTVEAVGTGPDTAGMRRVTFNPRREWDTFTCEGAPITEATRVAFTSDPATRRGYGWVA